MGSLALGCGPSTAGTDGSGTGTNGSDTTSADTTADGTADDGSTGDTALTSVSILVVLDNTPSMHGEQVPLAEALTGLADQLTSAGIEWRLGLTTTDNGNLWCTSTNPEAGNLVLSSCRSRATEFSYEGSPGFPDWYADMCQDQCPEQWANIAVTPTAVEGDGTAPRPWIEHSDGATNLPEGLPLADAMYCLVPLGIAGCGFESPLESMRRALDRADDTNFNEPNAGFVPDGALLAVVFVTDEIDCSANPEWATIFAPEGDRVFWSDPDAPAPTSAVCWNAGVQCSGGTCSSADFDALGNAVAPSDASTDAVIYPMSRFQARLSGFPEVLVTVIAGTQPDGSVVYADSPMDPEFMGDFGIGPGCESASSRAVPPVRLRELAENFAPEGGPLLSSVCDPNFSPVLTQLGDEIIARL